ncbi:MAG: anti-sigma factor family protein [Elusimicrobiota bacterium]
MNWNCEQASARLSAYADGELGREEARAMARHLAFCGPCLAEVRELERAKEVLAGERGGSLSEAESAELEAAVLARLSEKPALRPRRALALGAGLVLAGALVFFGTQRFPSEEKVPMSVLLAEHSRALSKSAVQRRTTLVAARFYTENVER